MCTVLYMFIIRRCSYHHQGPNMLCLNHLLCSPSLSQPGPLLTSGAGQDLLGTDPTQFSMGLQHPVRQTSRAVANQVHFYCQTEYLKAPLGLSPLLSVFAPPGSINPMFEQSPVRSSIRDISRQSQEPFTPAPPAAASTSSPPGSGAVSVSALDILTQGMSREDMYTRCQHMVRRGGDVAHVRIHLPNVRIGSRVSGSTPVLVLVISCYEQQKSMLRGSIFDLFDPFQAVKVCAGMHSTSRLLFLRQERACVDKLLVGKVARPTTV